MQYLKNISLLLVLSVFLSCGGDTTQTTSSNTDGDTFQLAILNVLNSNPNNGDGTMKVTEIKSDVNPSGGDQVIRISGTTGDETHPIQHQMEIHYYIYFQGMNTLGKITLITHAWGTTLSNSIDGGISVCENDCAGTEIHPALNTLIFKSQVLDVTSTPSTIDGTVVYP